MGLVLCSYSPALFHASSIHRLEVQALSLQEAAEPISPRSASTTTRGSTRRRTCNISRGRMVRGLGSIGGTTADWWLARCQCRTADRWTSRRAGLLRTRNFKLACSAEAYALLQLHLCLRHARRH